MSFIINFSAPSICELLHANQEVHPSVFANYHATFSAQAVYTRIKSGAAVFLCSLLIVV